MQIPDLDKKIAK